MYEVPSLQRGGEEEIGVLLCMRQELEPCPPIEPRSEHLIDCRFARTQLYDLGVDYSLRSESIVSFDHSCFGAWREFSDPFPAVSIALLRLQLCLEETVTKPDLIDNDAKELLVAHVCASCGKS